MTNKDLEFFKRNLDSYAMVDGLYINTISVLAPEGEYKITEDNANDTYLVEYIPNFGSKENSVHFTMSGVIEYIKEGVKYKE